MEKEKTEYDDARDHQDITDKVEKKIRLDVQSLFEFEKEFVHKTLQLLSGATRSICPRRPAFQNRRKFFSPTDDFVLLKAYRLNHSPSAVLNGLLKKWVATDLLSSIQSIAFSLFFFNCKANGEP